MELEHPAITSTRLTGYPYSTVKKIHTHDVLGNPVYLYDDVIAMPEGVYKVCGLSTKAIRELLNEGGIYQRITV